MDSQELKQIAKSSRRHPLWTPPASAVGTSLGRREIERLLPHRDPFLLLDQVTEVDLTEQTIRGQRRIDPDDPVFRGHFPGHPVYPGVLQLEMIGQLALCLLYFLTSGSTRITAATVPRNVRAVKVHFAEFLSPVGPGDELSVICRAIRLDDFTGICAGQILRKETICSFGVSEVYFLDE
jgi:3-hydroxyacyl-[acyl-carrier-protein] dehydratase